MTPGITRDVAPKQRFPLRLTVPAGLLLFVALATAWNLRVGREQVIEGVQREAIRDVTWTVAGLAADVERAYRVREEEAGQEKIAALGAHREFVFAVMLDDDHRVLHSMRVGDIGKSFQQVLPDAYEGISLLQPDSLAAIGQARGGKVEASGDGPTVVSAYPLTLGTRGGELRASRGGSLIAIYDSSALEAEALAVVTREALRFFYALVVFAAGLGLFFHFRIARRMGRLASVARQVGAGNMDVRSGLGGSDEVAELSWALDQMVSDKARAEAQTADRQSRLEAILNTAADAIITINARGIIQSANPATEKIFGYASAELLGSNIDRLMPAPYAEEHDQYLAAYVETGNRKIIGVGREIEAKRKDGRTFPIDLAVSESCVGGQRLFTGIVRDISERRLVEAEQQSLGRILEDSLNEIYVFDAETLLFVQANKGARENIGYSMDELRTLTPVDLKPDFTRQTFAELIEPLRSGARENVVFETVHCRRDGSRYDVEVHVQLGTFQGSRAFVAIILDTTQRKQAERSIRVQQRALDSAVNGIIITDPNQPDNPIVYVNPASLRITGYSEGEVLGQNCRFLQRDHREQEALEEVRAAIREERECKVVLRNFRKDGSPFWNELTISPVRDDNGVLTHFVGIQSDITARRDAEEALARVNQELEERVRERTRQLEEAQELLIRKEKLSTLGQLAAGVAHEIRNPMGVIRNASYFLEQTLADGDEDTREALGEISRGLASSERIVSELLDYAREPKAEASPFCLDDAIDSALRMVRMPASVRVERRDTAPVRASGDRGQIERLLANLIQNAAQAMADGGTLTLRCKSANGNVVAEVSDTGVGISADELEKIFEPLFTKKAKGIGLGLALCRRYAELNKGTLAVESEAGQGSTFRLSLPLPDSELPDSGLLDGELLDGELLDGELAEKETS